MKPKVLWIEDFALIDLQNWPAAVYVTGRHDLQIALDASDALRHLKKSEYDAVVVDIQIPPGNDDAWKKLYNQLGHNKATSRLGLHLLYSLLNPENAKVEVKPIPNWISSDRFGLLTIESRRNHEQDLKNLKIAVFREKTAEMPSTALLEVIEEILAKRGSGLA
jgi:hypothetical protein